jgi:hypothetical protein
LAGLVGAYHVGRRFRLSEPDTPANTTVSTATTEQINPTAEEQ